MHFFWLSLRLLSSRIHRLGLPDSSCLSASLLHLFSSVAAGLCVDESPAPPGSGGAAQEEMLHSALLPQPQFRCMPAVSCSWLAFRVPGLLFWEQCWILDLGQKMGSIKCLLFCSLAGRIRVRNFVWIPFVRPGVEWQCPLATGKDEFFLRESQWNREESSG